ncbi:hypothetical protein MW887_010721 [Aspergillus wentii]|nr:hypothetical protein MW887_010721 [Aspergillus wentii]
MSNGVFPSAQPGHACGWLTLTLGLLNNPAHLTEKKYPRSLWPRSTSRKIQGKAQFPHNILVADRATQEFDSDQGYEIEAELNDTITRVIEIRKSTFRKDKRWLKAFGRLK